MLALFTIIIFLKLNGFRVGEIFVCNKAEHKNTFQGLRIYPVIFKLGLILLFLKFKQIKARTIGFTTTIQEDIFWWSLRAHHWKRFFQVSALSKSVEWQLGPKWYNSILEENISLQRPHSQIQVKNRLLIMIISYDTGDWNFNMDKHEIKEICTTQWCRMISCRRKDQNVKDGDGQ